MYWVPSKICSQFERKRENPSAFKKQARWQRDAEPNVHALSINLAKRLPAVALALLLGLSTPAVGLRLTVPLLSGTASRSGGAALGAQGPRDSCDHPREWIVPPV
jgi:hypothetical protein